MNLNFDFSTGQVPPRWVLQFRQLLEQVCLINNKKNLLFFFFAMMKGILFFSFVPLADSIGGAIPDCSSSRTFYQSVKSSTLLVSGCWFSLSRRNARRRGLRGYFTGKQVILWIASLDCVAWIFSCYVFLWGSFWCLIWFDIYDKNIRL